MLNKYHKSNRKNPVKNEKKQIHEPAQSPSSGWRSAGGRRRARPTAKTIFRSGSSPTVDCRRAARSDSTAPAPTIRTITSAVILASDQLKRFENRSIFDAFVQSCSCIAAILLITPRSFTSAPSAAATSSLHSATLS